MSRAGCNDIWILFLNKGGNRYDNIRYIISFVHIRFSRYFL
jgi:hypothetical protein